MSDLLVETRGHVALLTLNRPDRLNAITFAMLDALTAALGQAEQDDQVRAIVITGAGRGFCSGLDLKEAAAGQGIGGTLSGAAGVRHLATRDLPTVVLHQLDTPVICAINGAAAGYGLDLALGCDLRVMASGAKLIPGFAKRAIIPESGGTWYLPRLVGWAKACEIGFLGEDLPAERACELGLVNRVVPDAELQGAAFAWARQIASGPPIALRYMKDNLNRALTDSLASVLDVEADRMVQGAQTEDYLEAVAAFAEKRAPVFKGK
jgi:enoyl-CoA hydratase/carnithine racemase